MENWELRRFGEPLQYWDCWAGVFFSHMIGNWEQLRTRLQFQAGVKLDTGSPKPRDERPNRDVDVYPILASYMTRDNRLL